jgi:hypothetical protein
MSKPNINMLPKTLAIHDSIIQETFRQNLMLPYLRSEVPEL